MPDIADTLDGIGRWLVGPVADVAAPGRGSLNLLRGIAARATVPLLPDDYLHLINPLWSARELRGRVVEVRPETPDSATLVIKPGWGFSYDYQPGQYIGIGVSVDGRWHWRSYSLISPPGRDRAISRRDAAGTVSIAVKAMPDGFLSEHLVRGVPAGTIVRLALPAGNFRLPEPPPPRILFLTAGSGITPVMGMLRTMARRDNLTEIVHVHSELTRAGVMFADELEELERRFPGRYRLRAQQTLEDGRITRARLDELVPDWRARPSWVCGPASLLDDAERWWTEAGLADRLRAERFELPRGAAGEGGTITFAKSGRTVIADGATSLLHAGEGIGVTMPFGCRMGICHTCLVGLAQGAVVDLRSGIEYLAGDRIQTCVSAAAGDCTLDC
ncbi:ferredoxin reductase [Antrihabitans cavernicola]|uniref:ferredoxin reductase n=1 Tax=Antrihabitans cavernicola TaxID=2495913 RepID=UPI0035300C80